MHKTISALLGLTLGVLLAAGGCDTSTNTGPTQPHSTTIPGCTGPDHRESPCPGQPVAVVP